MPPETPKRSRSVRNLIDRIRGRKEETRESAVGEAMEIADIRGTVEEHTEEARGRTAAMPEPGVDPLDRTAWQRVLAHEQDIPPEHRLALDTDRRAILQRAGDRDGLRRLAFGSLHALHSSDNLRYAEETLGLIGESIAPTVWEGVAERAEESGKFVIAWLAYNKAADGHAMSEPLNKEYRGTKARCLFDLAYKSMMSQPDYYRGAGPEGATLSGYCELFRVIHRRMPNRDEFLAIGHEAFEKKKIATAQAAYYLAYGVQEYDSKQLTEIPADILVKLADTIIIRYEQNPEDTRHDGSYDFIYYVIPFYRAANHKPGLRRVAQVRLKAGDWNGARAILTEIGEPPDKAWYKAVAAKERPVYHYSAREVLCAGGCTEELIALGDGMLEIPDKTVETIIEAQRCYRGAQHSPGLKKAGDAYVEAGDFKYALDCYREARHEITDPAFFEGLAMQYLEEGEINSAQAAFKKALMLSGGGGGSGGSSTPSPASPDGTDDSGPATPGREQAETATGSGETSGSLKQVAA